MEIEISCTSVHAVYMEEGKELAEYRWCLSVAQKMYCHEAGYSVVFCTDLKLLDFSQPPTLTWLSHKSSLLYAVTYLCLRIVQEEVMVLTVVDGACCMSDLPFQLCIRIYSDSSYRHLSQKLFMTVSENSDIQRFTFLTCRMVLLRRSCHLCGWSAVYLTIFHLNCISCTELFDSFSVAVLENVFLQLQY